MVICRYFVQGNCRFGANCRNEHAYNTNPGHTSILRSPQQSNVNEQIDTTNIIRSVSNDMIMAERGKQWVLSCYAPIKEKPNFPEFEDYSFEEIRLQCYEAQKNGTIEQYKLNLTKLLLEAVQRMKMLQNPSGDIVNIIRKIYYGPSVQTVVAGSTFSGNTNQKSNFNNVSNSPFGSAASTNNSIFGSKSTFGQQSSSYGLQQNVFTTPQSPAGSIFAQKPATTGSIFGGPATQNSAPLNSTGFVQSPGMFGQVNKNTQHTVQTNSNIFNQQVGLQNQPQNVFRQSSASVTTTFPQQSSVFGGTTTSQNTSIFGNATVTTQNSIFTNTASVTQSKPGFDTNISNSYPIFGNTQTTAQNTVFSGKNTVNQSSIFGAAVTNQTPSIFGNSASIESKTAMIGSPSLGGNKTNPGVFGGNKQSEHNISIYSKHDELNENDIKAFNSDNFVFGNLPELPPLAEMC